MLEFAMFERVWFLTWTTYGTWLPGDERGFVSPKFEGDLPESRHNVLGTPYDDGREPLEELTRGKLAGPPVLLDARQAAVLRAQFEETAHYRGWSIAAGAVMSNHVHLVVGVTGDPDPASLMRDFKSYGSRALNRQFGKPASDTWWTEQGSKRKIDDARHFAAVVAYVLRQSMPLEIWQGERGA